MKLPLGGLEADFDSKKSRSQIINLIAEGDDKQGYRTVRRTEGLTSSVGYAVELSDSPVRSDLLLNAGWIYVVAGETLFRVSSTGVAANLGIVGGQGRARLLANALPGDSQILILNGLGNGYIYSDLLGLDAISDLDFFLSSSASVLNERFWLARDNSNEFFGSDISDGTSYNPLTFGTADESPDDVVAVVAKKSALWVLGSDTSQYFQTFDNSTFPLRNTKGAGKEWGILISATLAEVNEYFCFLADDRSVRMVIGDQMIKISDLEFNLMINGNGTTTNPGFSRIDDAYGFFVDGPVHSTYYISFPSEGYTWGYDVNTKMSHRRASEATNYWRVNGSVKVGDRIYCGDAISGNIWLLDHSNMTEDGGVLRTKLVTKSISFPRNVTISLIELDMEVALLTDLDLDPQLLVFYTKDGGMTWIQKSSISLGKVGQYRTRVTLRQFGRLVRHKDFALRLETTEAVGVQYYGAEIYHEVAM